MRVTCPCCSCTHFQQHRDLFQGEGRNQAAGQVHMNFIRATGIETAIERAAYHLAGEDTARKVLEVQVLEKSLVG